MMPVETLKESERKVNDEESEKDSEDEWKYVDFFESSPHWVHMMKIKKRNKGGKRKEQNQKQDKR
jgi:hypothetical protein